nr:TonB-dependent receptor [Pedobacter sp. SYSU D00873]
MGLITLETFAQGTGKIVGKVTDKKTGETLIGLNVKIVGQTKGASTDVEGRYVISGLAAGKYSVQFSYVGYATKTISDVAVSAGVVTTLNTLMEEGGSNQLKAVVVTVTAKQESVSGLYAQQKNSAVISDGMSADVIKKSPDRNTGEVLKRVSGASVQDNRFIIVRGLSDRYNSAMINNTPLPSSEPDRKTFSFDAIPSNLIDNVIISKTATPDLPGDFSGGAVQVKTKDFPDNKTLTVNYGVGYNSISTFQPFYGRQRSVLESFGFASSSRNLPSGFPQSLERYTNLPAATKASLSNQFNNTWGVGDQGTAIPTQNLQVVFGNSYISKNNNKLGFILSTTYRTGATVSNEIRNDYNEVNWSTRTSAPLFEYSDKYYNFSSNLGVLANLAYSFKGSKLALKTLYNKSFEDSYLNRYGAYDNRTEFRRVSQQEAVDKSLINTVLEGDHLVSSKSKSKVNWNLSFSRLTNDQPDLKRLFYSKLASDMDNPSVPFTAAVPLVATASTSGRFYSDLGENVLGGSFNYTLPFKLADESQVLKIGVLKQFKDREVNARVLGYINNSSDQSLLTLPQDELFSSRNIGPDKFYIEDITNPDNQYTGSGDLNSAYFMLNNSFKQNLKIAWGLRVENYIEKLNSRTNAGKVQVDNNYLDFLPSLNATYSLNDKTNVRLSYSNTVARAQFRELAPFSFYDFITGNVKIGNVNLKRTRINNYDTRFEYYPSAGQVISVSAFYKRLNNPIESIVTIGSSAASKGMTYTNAPKADVYGLEFEIRHSLGFINENSNLLKNLTFNANTAFMKSQVNFEDILTVETNRPLQGQSPYLINTGLQYSSAKSGWQGSLLYNRIGRRLSVVGFGKVENGMFEADYPDIYEAPRNILDLQIAKRILRQRGEVKLNVSNIFDSDNVYYQDLDKDKQYSTGDQLINSIQFGRTFSLSVGYSF